MLSGSYISPKSRIYKKSEKDFKKNLLVTDFEKKKKKKKKKKTSLKEFLELCQS